MCGGGQRELLMRRVADVENRASQVTGSVRGR